ncbi:glutamyl-tRNA reductase [candidate division CSSED10-310 bacterium]|uniref:Glutamyl-tRNA reductase n=1 Tax=candidate division CSSED10-310 bacterium TaxID=2855610 RepID=A0ABV6YVC8_UNCC1
MVDYFIVGLNHKTAPVELREKLHFPEAELGQALTKISRRTVVDEIMILSTCNRVEFIGVCARLEKMVDILTHFLSVVKTVSLEKLEKNLYFFKHSEAVKHIFRVASSLDSMVIGEPQILGQLKTAMRIAEHAETLGKNLKYLLPEAIRVAKKVRNQTNIAAQAVSVSFVAVELAKRLLGDLSGCNIMVIGTGKMSALALQHLSKQTGTGQLFVTNRTENHARQIAQEFGGTLVPYAQFKDKLGHIDIILTSTASSEYILDAADIEEMMSHRASRPLFIIDIAVPRDIDPALKSLPHVHLYDIDDLRETVSQNIKFREQEADRAEKIIAEEVQRFEQEQHLKRIKPVIISLRHYFEQIRHEELNRHTKELVKMNQHEREFVEHITQSLINRLLHTPLCSLKSDLIPHKVLPPMEVVARIFGLQNSGDLVCLEERDLE